MKRIIHTTNAPAPIGPYNQAIEVDSLLYVSGQISIDPATNAVISSSIADETKQVMENIIAILDAAGYKTGNVIKSTIFLSNMSHFAEVNEIYGSYFTSDFPARETVAVAGLPKNVNVEISVIACKS
ncbi:MAG TPA: reactive intermediate/imine deaminase [Sphingobacteriaceae bacterium]|nr:reactive intermediate/imine deaminase [Sphingobacteriaceae bacterium]